MSLGDLSCWTRRRAQNQPAKRGRDALGSDDDEDNDDDDDDDDEDGDGAAPPAGEPASSMARLAAVTPICVSGGITHHSGCSFLRTATIYHRATTTICSGRLPPFEGPTCHLNPHIEMVFSLSAGRDEEMPDASAGDDAAASQSARRRGGRRRSSAQGGADGAGPSGRATQVSRTLL